MANYILVIDAGTTGVQASLFDTLHFKMFGNVKIEFKQYYPQPGYVEHDPNEIWKATCQSIKKTISLVKKEQKDFSIHQILSIGITNQRETCLGWNLKTFDTPFRALVWQDRRTADFCTHLKTKTRFHKKIQKITGLVCDPYFSATKMSWLLQNNETIQKWSQNNTLALGTIDSFLIWKLTNHVEFVTDHTNASRTMLYDLKTGAYSEELLNLFKVPKHTLPKILPSSGLFGKTKGLKFLPDGIPITGVLGDQQSALYGQRCLKKGNSKITFGTGAFILMHTGDAPIPSAHGLLSTVAYSKGNKRTFALEGSAFIAGAAVQFLRDNFEWFKEAKASEYLALEEPRDPDVLFVPALVGLGAPYWNPNAKGVLWGLTRGTEKSQIIRAVLESIALQNVTLLDLIQKESKISISKLGVDGGGSANKFMMQFQSDLLQTTLNRPHNLQTTSLGAALASYEAFYDTSAKYLPKTTIFKPQMSFQDSNEIIEKWTRAVEHTNRFYEK